MPERRGDLVSLLVGGIIVFLFFLAKREQQLSQGATQQLTGQSVGATGSCACCSTAPAPTSILPPDDNDGGTGRYIKPSFCVGDCGGSALTAQYFG